MLKPVKPVPVRVETRAALERYPDRAAWLAARQTGLGASDSGVILGLAPWKAAYTLWAERSNLVSPDGDDAPELRWGRRLEPAILAGYAEETGQIVTPMAANALFRSPDHPWLFATPDGWTGEPRVVEAKAVSEWSRDDWADGAAPLLYHVQVQAQLLVLGWTHGDLAALVGGHRLEIVPVTADPAFQRELLEVLRAFWTRIQRREPPEPGHTDSARRTLERRYPQAQLGQAIELPPEASEWDAEIATVHAQQKALEIKEGDLKNRLRAALGAAEVGRLPNGHEWVWTAKTLPERTLPAVTYRELRRRRTKKGV